MQPGGLEFSVALRSLEGLINTEVSEMAMKLSKWRYWNCQRVRSRIQGYMNSPRRFALLRLQNVNKIPLLCSFH
jgi:retron-type reverse transcriptase